MHDVLHVTAVELGGVGAIGERNRVETLAATADVDADHRGIGRRQNAHDGANISCSTPSTCSRVASGSTPRRFTNRSRSTVRS